MREEIPAVARVVGFLLVGLGVLHGPVLWFSGTSWEGAVSWRKPILFGISGGVTVLSIGWVAGKLRNSRVAIRLASILAIAMLVEVGLITLQQWRGVASHFNRETPLDAAVSLGIELLAVGMTLLIADFTRRSLDSLSVDRGMAFAIRCGMGLLLLACLLGVAMVVYGNLRIASGGSPETFGQAGVTKFPHGVPMHVIQFLPLLAWGLARLGVCLRQRLLMVRLVGLGFCCLTAMSLVQTLTGRSRFDLHPVSVLLVAVTVLLFVLPVGVLVRDSSRQRTRSSTGPVKSWPNAR